MTAEEFKEKLNELYSEYDVSGEDGTGHIVYVNSNGRGDANVHSDADDLLVEALESLGYNLERYKKATKWYD